MNKMNPKVDGYVRKSKQWQEELQKLRTIILDCAADRRSEVAEPLLYV